MEESFFRQNKASTEQTFDSEEINVAYANDHPSHPLSSKDSTITTNKPIDIDPAESSAQISHQKCLNQNQNKQKENGINQEKSKQNMIEENAEKIESEKEEKNETTRSRKDQQKGRRVNFQCWNCELSFGSKYLLKKHTRSEHENKEPVQCEICKKCFAKQQVLQFHINVQHNKMQPFKCPACPDTFKYKYQLKDHATIGHDKA
jgi:hypothetical protein